MAAGPRGAPRERVADHTVEHHVEGPEHLDVIGAVARDAEPAGTIKLLRRDVDERVAGAGAHHRDVRAPSVQPAGADQRTAAVAAGPGEHDDAPTLEGRRRGSEPGRAV